VKNQACAATLVIVAGSPAGAVDEANFLLSSAGDLAALCAAPAEPASIHMCQGYLVGVNHMNSAVEQALGIKVYCLPTDGSVTRDTAARDFSVWVAATPGAASMPAREGLLKWAQITYPCK
jgi:hypothetical protein